MINANEFKNYLIQKGYMPHSSIMLSYGLKKGHASEIVSCMDKIGRIKDIPEKVYAAFYIEDFKKLFLLSV